MKKKFILFLNGTYKKEDIEFYKELIGTKTSVAVDGGYEFFQQAKIKPDYIIGDMDSIDTMEDSIPDDIAVFEFPKDKDLTDGHAALDFCMKEDFSSIEVVMPNIGEPDHFIGNILLLFHKDVKKKIREKRSVMFICRDYEYRILDNSKLEILDAAGDTFSILPISKSIMLFCEGTQYDVKNLKIDLGETRGLRNKIVANEMMLKISGEAIFIRKRNNLND